MIDAHSSADRSDDGVPDFQTRLALQKEEIKARDDDNRFLLTRTELNTLVWPGMGLVGVGIGAVYS